MLIDEAGLFEPAEFERLIQLPNALVMAGLPSLSERLSFCPDPFHRVTLEPLAPEDVARFVLARLAASGCPRASFTPEALATLARQSSGLLRLVIILAGAATFFAEQRGAAKVAAADVSEAASMRTILPEATEQEAAPGAAIAGTDLPGESAVRAAPAAGPAWLGPVAARRQWGRPVVLAGLAGWVCASLAVIGVATIAARGIGPLPSMTVQELRGRSAPLLASAAIPDLALSPAVQPALPSPVQTAAALPPAQAVTSPPAPEPAPSPETGWSDADIPRVVDGGAGTPMRSLPAPPAPPLSLQNPAESPSTVLAFAGPILNETMGQSGQLSLQLRTHGAHGPVAAVFTPPKG